MLTDETREKVHEAVRAALGDAYDCTRVWQAWSIGTMGPGDFHLVADSDERVNEIVDGVVGVLHTPAVLSAATLDAAITIVREARDAIGAGSDAVQSSPERSMVGPYLDGIEDELRALYSTAAESDINPVELIGAEFTKCHSPEADPRAVDVLVEALSCTLEEHGFAVVALEDAEAIKHHGARRLYPDDLSDELRYVLGFMTYRSAPIAHLMRAAGADIKRKIEDEQAVVLHWLVRLVLDHGANWASAGEAQLGAFKAQIAAAAKAAAGGAA